MNVSPDILSNSKHITADNLNLKNQGVPHMIRPFFVRKTAIQGMGWALERGLSIWVHVGKT
tara:strand:+ start:74 stop:256 length:183 start_codon:yes stop_codon:yes gene_type:complete